MNKAFIFIILLCTMIASHAGIPPASDDVSEELPNVKLSWENDKHSERIGWSKTLLVEVDKKFDSLDKAKDSEYFCHAYHSLSRIQKIQLWAEMFVWTAWYESRWNPDSSDVDVGNKDDKDTWSVGLLQLSVVDQKDYGIPYNLNFKDLEDAPDNIKLGVAIMSKQIDRHGQILLHKHPYWATLHPYGKYDQSQKIAYHTSSLAFCK